MTSTATTTKKAYTEIEAIIEERIAKESEEYDLDHWDIADIRLECYKENGWSYDPFPEEEDEDEDDWEEEEEWRPSTMSQMLAELGMSERDFF